jgi:hypothetical protein
MAVVMTVALVIGSVAVAATVADVVQSRLGASTTTKVPTASGLSSKQKLTLKAKVLQGPLIPGVTRPLKVTMANPLRQRLKVTAVTVTPSKPAVSACKKSWVKTTSFKASKKKKPIIVKPRGKATVMLTVQLTNLSSVNQDACKNTRIPLKLNATARQG